MLRLDWLTTVRARSLFPRSGRRASSRWHRRGRFVPISCGVERLEDRTLLSGHEGGGGNHAPSANSDSYNIYYDTLDTSADGKPSVLGNDFDMDSDPLTAVLVSTASHGTLSLNSNGHSRTS